MGWWLAGGGCLRWCAAAVAAGEVWLSHGSDIGGSLRFPSYACGVCSVKPGFGRVPAFNPSAAAERGMLAQAYGLAAYIKDPAPTTVLVVHGSGIDGRSKLVNAAKKSATRVARIEKFRDKILAGKGAQER